MIILVRVEGDLSRVQWGIDRSLSRLMLEEKSLLSFRQP